jgi:sugar-specific transcriptional regulator TrmB
MDLELIEQLGFTRTESKIYVTLLEFGSSRAGKLSKKSGIHRRSVYDAVERLIEKGLVSYIKRNNITFFEAVNPDKLVELVHEKEKNIQALLPELNLKYKLSKEKEETLFFRGKPSLKTVFDDQIQTGKEILIMGASTKAPEILNYYFPHFDKERVRKKINVKIIFDETARNKEYVKKIPLSEIRFVPKEYASFAATNIYADKICIVLWSEEPIAILIKNNEIAKGYKNYFELVWNIARK